MKPRQTLYLLASDHEFRLLRGRGTELSELAHRRATDFPDVELGFHGEPSRGHASGVSFGVNDRGAHEAEERRRLVRHALEALKAAWDKEQDDGIVMVAGPKTLGALRELMPKALACHVVAELAKNLADVPAHDLPAHFAALPKD